MRTFNQKELEDCFLMRSVNILNRVCIELCVTQGADRQKPIEAPSTCRLLASGGEYVDAHYLPPVTPGSNEAASDTEMDTYADAHTCAHCIKVQIMEDIVWLMTCRINK